MVSQRVEAILRECPPTMGSGFPPSEKESSQKRRENAVKKVKSLLEQVQNNIKVIYVVYEITRLPYCRVSLLSVSCEGKLLLTRLWERSIIHDEEAVISGHLSKVDLNAHETRSTGSEQTRSLIDPSRTDAPRAYIEVGTGWSMQRVLRLRLLDGTSQTEVEEAPGYVRWYLTCSSKFLQSTSSRARVFAVRAEASWKHQCMTPQRDTLSIALPFYVLLCQTL